MMKFRVQLKVKVNFYYVKLFFLVLGYILEKVLCYILLALMRGSMLHEQHITWRVPATEQQHDAVLLIILLFCLRRRSSVKFVFHSFHYNRYPAVEVPNYFE